MAKGSAGQGIALRGGCGGTLFSPAARAARFGSGTTIKGVFFFSSFPVVMKMCFAHILFDNQLVSFQKFPVFSGTGNPEFVVMRGPCCLYFFFASLPIGIGRQQKVTKKKASFGQRLGHR